MSKIYLIAGLGADTRIYQNINLDGHSVTPVDWIEPRKTDTLTTYAGLLIEQYHIVPGSVVIGNSMGGMIAIEMAKQMKLGKVILISSIKSINEAPAYFSVFRKLPIYKIIPNNLLISSAVYAKRIFMGTNGITLFEDMLRKSSPFFLKWAMSAVLNWDNTVIPANVYQISGDKDIILPPKKTENITIVPGGKHNMLFARYHEVEVYLKAILIEN